MTERAKRHFRGYPVPYLRGHARHKTGAASHKWKGGRWVHGEGYIYIHVPDHPAANQDGYVFEHRLVMEQTLGRRLAADEVVHHINHQKGDNRPENLMVMTKGDHATLHGPERIHDPEKHREGGRKGAAARWHKDQS